MTNKQTAYYNDLVQLFKDYMDKEFKDLDERLVREETALFPEYENKKNILKNGMLNLVNNLGVKFLDRSNRINVYGKFDKNMGILYLFAHNHK